jgi:hypothetical protein
MRRWHQTTAVAAAVAALALAGCGGSSPSNGVASLSGSTGKDPASTTTTLPKGSPTQLLNEWAACMRQHGMANVADPTIDANGVIHITLPSGSPTQYQTIQGTCKAYLSAASTALGGGHPGQKPDPAKLLAFSECMRAHGVADFPDPSGNGLQIGSRGPSSDLNPNNPTFQAAQKVCAKQDNLPGLGGGAPQRGSIEVTGNGQGGMFKSVTAG